MYAALFHVTGIAILEICFYFYYIGPMETVIFEDKVKKLANEPFKLTDNSHTPIPTPSSEYNYLHYLFADGRNDSNQTIEEYLKDERDKAIDKREEKNKKLFDETLQVWFILLIGSFVIFLIEWKIKSILKVRKQNGVISIETESEDNLDESLESGLELQNIPIYRKSSFDQDNLETNNCKEFRKKAFFKLAHYTFFACCILGFQYFFFQNVVLNYDPLSMQEVKYMIYTSLQPELKILFGD